MSENAPAREIIHDLNNLFAALSGFAQFLVDDLAPGSVEHGMATKILQGQIAAEELVSRLRDAGVKNGAGAPHATTRQPA